ncbi:MAG TPA: cytochrome c oxidase subunit 4 [Acidimicrobiales bacterium]|jgi:hypothetical protein|nr:cytochrome c oxidase subunit 4 [Acidimicrobiales bacterium]
MKLEWRVTLGAAFFLLAAFALYWFTSYEDAGSVLLFFGGTAYILLFAFILLQYKRRHGTPRAEDRPDANQSDGAGEVAFFPSNSIWPVSLGIGFVFVAVGLVYGAWYFAIGFILLLGAVIGFNVEADSRTESDSHPEQHSHTE